MKKQSDMLQKFPALLSSKASIFIYLFLFFYLVLFAFLCMVVPALNAWKPSDATQLILGNYTNVLSALGASLAAGTGVAVHSGVRALHARHDKLAQTLAQLHQKIDRLEAAQQQGRAPESSQ